MKHHFSRQTALLAAAALFGSLFLAACGGGGGGGDSSTPTPDVLPPIVGSTAGIVEGIVLGTTSGTTTGVVNGTSTGVVNGTSTGTVVGVVNGTVTGSVTQPSGTGTTSSNVVNTPINSAGSVTVTGIVTGTVTGTVVGSVDGTVVGTTTGTVTGVVQGSASGTVTPPAVSAAPAAAIAKGFLQSYDALRSSFKPSGTDTYSLHDSCLLENGRNKALLITDWNTTTDIQARRAFDVGSVRANTPVTVLADRAITNADGTARRELDIQYSVVYTDGTRDNTATSTIVSGSSSGARNADGTACTTPESKAEWRFKGNGRIVDFGMVANNQEIVRFSLATGLGRTPPTQYESFMGINLSDPANVATYFTISGPGIVTGSSAPITIMAMSPRVVRDAPEFAGNIVGRANYRDIDNFRFCRVSATNGRYAEAALADCKTAGIGSGQYGAGRGDTPAAADSLFAVLPFAVGQTYTVKVYAGDGWKTVGGVTSATPIATITHTLDVVPYSAAALKAADSFPDLGTVTLTSVAGVTDTAASLAKLIRDKSAFSADVSWDTPSALMPDGSLTKLNFLNYFTQGRATASTTDNFPRHRKSTTYYPASTATNFSLSQPAAEAGLITPQYGEINLSYTNRNGNRVEFLATFD